MLLAAAESNKGRGLIKFCQQLSVFMINDIVNGFSQVLKLFFNFYFRSVSHGLDFAELLEMETLRKLIKPMLPLFDGSERRTISNMAVCASITFGFHKL
jgi:hypothetical protein